MANLDVKGPPLYSNEIRKLEVTDPAHADLFNPIHAQLLENEEYLKQELEQGDSGSRTVAFEEAADRVTIASGESHRTLFGKIKKLFTDLKAVAFTGRYLDLTGIPAEATGLAAGLMSAADKTKLDGVEAGANEYTHPSTHPATMIIQDDTHRFATDAEKTTWNAKAGTAVASTTANGLMTSADKVKLNGIAEGANKYVHPTTAGNKHIPAGGASGQILRWLSDGAAKWDKVDEYVHPSTAGNKHIPAGGASGQILRWSADGTAAWGADNNTVYTHPNSGVAAGTYRSVTVNAQGHVTAGSNPALNYLPLSGGTISGNLTVSGTITGSKVYGAVYNDLAEWFPKQDLTEEFEPGDVVIWDKTGIVKARAANSPVAVGAYSDSYSTILGGEQLENMEDNLINFLPIGLAGRIFVKVTGKVNAGDLLVSSDIPGAAKVDNQASVRTVLGKALSSAPDDGSVHKVMMVIK